MYYVKEGLEAGPVLCCIPGLMGGPEDFNAMLEFLKDKFSLIIIDPNQERRTQEGLNLSVESMKAISYDSTAAGIKSLLDDLYPHSQYYFLGISLGGKVVYDFASRFPDSFAGGVITDVGPGPFSESDHFKVVEKIVDETDLNLPWPELKKQLVQNIPDKSLRILIQTQIHYPDKVPPAIWKTGMKNFEELLKRQSLDLQGSALIKVDQQLSSEKRFIDVLRCENNSGIGQKSLEEMRKLSFIRIHDIPDSTHFLHISHKDLIVEKVLKMLES